MEAQGVERKLTITLRADIAYLFRLVCEESEAAPRAHKAYREAMDGLIAEFLVSCSLLRATAYWRSSPARSRLRDA